MTASIDQVVRETHVHMYLRAIYVVVRLVNTSP